MGAGIDWASGAAAPAGALRAFVSGFGLIALFACGGTPGLEPPVADQSVRGPSAAPPVSFGNSTGAQPTQPVMGAAGGAALPNNPMTTPPPNAPGTAAPGDMGAGGAGGMQAMMPSPGDPTSPGSSDGGIPPTNGLGAVDFRPECADETAQVLTAEGVCSFPLPDGAELAPDLAQIALVSNGAFSLVAHVDGPLGCDLLNGGFYFDRAESPTRIMLCTQSCLRAGAAAEMQVVLVLGCAPSAP